MASNRPFGQARGDAPAWGQRRSAAEGWFQATEGRVLWPDCGVAPYLWCGHRKISPGGGARRAVHSGEIIPVK